MKKQLTACVLLLGLGLLVSGCNRPPQVGPQNRRLVESLKTAVMAKNPDWLAENAKLLETAHADGQISDDAYQALATVVREATSGNWPDAQSEIMRIAAGQKGAAAEADAAKTRKRAP